MEFSKKLENHAASLRYTLLFCRVHGTLRVTPAMEARLSDHVRSIEDSIGLLDRRSEVAA
jgi:hypothetical protein